MTAPGPRRLPLQGLLLVLWGQMSVALCADNPLVQLIFCGVMVATVGLQLLPWRLEIARDRAQLFVAVGVLGYVAYGLVTQIDRSQMAASVSRFFTGFILLFTVHQLGAFLRLGRGGGPGPLYVVSGIHLIGAADESRRSELIYYMVAGWILLALISLRLAATGPPDPDRVNPDGMSVSPSRRRWCTWPMVLTLVLLAAVATGLAAGLPQLQRLAMSGLGRGRGGGQGMTGLDPTRAEIPLGQVARLKRSSQVALRVFGERALLGGRLRVMAYADFRDQAWRNGRQAFRPARVHGTSRVEDGGVTDFLLHSGDPPPGIALGRAELRPAGDNLLRVLPLLERTWSVTLEGAELLEGPEGSYLVSEPADLERYEAVFLQVAPLPPSPPPPLPRESLARYLHGSDPLPPIVQTLADEVCAGAATAGEAARRLEAWLRDAEHFTYSLEVDPGTGVEEFLAPEGRRGWCEYFATTLALMLRSQGLPSRFVTGYVCGEWNRAGGYVVVRDWDAHAWVEAHVPGEGWVTLDPTPVALRRMEGEEVSGLLSGLWDWMGVTLAEVRRSLARRDLGGALAALLDGVIEAGRAILLHPLGLTLLGLLMLWLVLHLLRRRRSRTSRIPWWEAADPAPALLHEAWLSLREAVAASGVPLRGGETPRQVQERLLTAAPPGGPRPEAVGRMVELIYRCRYGGEPLELEQVQRAARPFMQSRRSSPPGRP